MNKKKIRLKIGPPYGYQKCMFQQVESSSEYIGPPNCVQYGVWG